MIKPIVVQKYGGTSVATHPRMHEIAKHIQTNVQNVKTVVVVSAMGNTTDDLLSACQHLSPGSSIEKDLLLATGEIASAAQMTMALKQLGVLTSCLTPWQMPIRTTEHPGHAWIRSIGLQNILKDFEKVDVVVVPGFQGVHNQTITTLGRGGTDLSAVALSVALEAERCEIYTDVPGVMTADPKVAPRARLLRHISMDAMIEFSYAGAKVLQPRCVTLAKRFGVALSVRSSFDFQQPGTNVTKEISMERTVLSGVALHAKDTYIEVKAPKDVEFSSWLQDSTTPQSRLRWFKQTEQHIQAGILVATEHAAGLADALKVHSHWEIIKKEVAEVSLVGTGLRMDPSLVHSIFNALSKQTIEVLDIRISDNSISCLVDQAQGVQTVRLLHETFGLEKEPN